jgi:ribosome-binding protein aMBF1 (putative translation factor)
VSHLPNVRPAYRAQIDLTPCRKCEDFGRHTKLREVLSSVTTAHISADIQGSVWPYAMSQLQTVRPTYRAQSSLIPCNECQKFGRHTGLRVALRRATTAKRSVGIQGSVWPYAVPRLSNVRSVYRAQSGRTQCHKCQEFGRLTETRVALFRATTAKSSAGLKASVWP